jgi:hypothetical protein
MVGDQGVEVWVYRLLGDEIVNIDSGTDNTRLGKITNFEGGKPDAVETDEKVGEDGVITEVEPRDESGIVHQCVFDQRLHSKSLR